MRLRDLDDKYLPALARRLDDLIHRIPDPVPEPNGPLPVIRRLRRIDDRWAARGPLALFRDVPQLGAVVIALLVLVNAVTVGARTEDDRAGNGTAADGERRPGAEDPDDDTRIGPDIGDSVAAYLRDSRAALIRNGSGQPDGMTVAVISFSSYLTPEQVRDRVGPVQVRRIFYRPQLPLPETQPQSAGVEDLVRDSRKEFARVAAVQTREAAALLSVARTNKTDPAQKAHDEKQAAYHQNVAKILRGPCPCIYAVVVRTRYRLLLDLLAVKGIRTIDASRPGGEVGDYDFAGLLPEEKKTVTGGNQA